MDAKKTVDTFKVLFTNVQMTKPHMDGIARLSRIVTPILAAAGSETEWTASFPRAAVLKMWLEADEVRQVRGMFVAFQSSLLARLMPLSLEHLSKQHKRFLLEPSFISGLTAELDIEVEGGRGAKRGRVGAGGVSDEVDKFAVRDYKDALLKMALADGRPLSLGDSVGFRQFAAELSLPYVSRNALNLHFKNRVATLSLTAEEGGSGKGRGARGRGVDWMFVFRPLRSQCARRARASAQGGGPYFLRYPQIPPPRRHLTPHYPRERLGGRAPAASYYPVIPAPPLLGPCMDKRSIFSLSSILLSIL